MLINEEKIYKNARKENWQLYITMLFLILSGFFAFPFFSVQSLLPTSVLIYWAFRINQFNVCENKYLLSIEKDLDKLISSGMSEHDAMIKLGCHINYYKPFWAIK